METRTAVYRGATKEKAERAYHADARQAATAGFVPTAETWSIALGQQVLTVTFVHDPTQAPAVLAALASMVAPAPPAAPPAASTQPPLFWAAPPPSQGSNGLRPFLVLAVLIGLGVIWALRGSGLSDSGGNATEPPPAPSSPWTIRSIAAVSGTFGPDGARYALPGQEVGGFLSCNPLRISIEKVATLDVTGGQRAVAWLENTTGAGADPRRDDCDRGILAVDEIGKIYYAYPGTSWLDDGLTPPSADLGWQHVVVLQASKHLRLVMSDIKGNDVITLDLLTAFGYSAASRPEAVIKALAAASARK